MKSYLAVISAALFAVFSGNAQTTNGSIYGSILVTSGGAVPRAVVTAFNVKTGVRLSTLNNEAGVVGDNFNGVRSQSQNVTLDGANIQENRYNGGRNSGNTTAQMAVDLVAEFRVSTARSMPNSAAA